MGVATDLLPHEVLTDTQTYNIISTY